VLNEQLFVELDRNST